MTSPDNDRIHGWKAIAEYLLRDERTAKRWEKQRGLPVRRIPGEGRANVYVQRSEVEAWLRYGTSAPQGESGAPEEVETGTPAEQVHDESGTPPDAIGAETAEVIPAEYTMLEQTMLEDGEPPVSAASPVFRPSQHISLIVSGLGLVLLLAATAVRFFRLGPLESILFASESMQSAPAQSALTQQRDDLYLRAVYLSEQRSPAALEEARGLFEGAIADDPQHAASYSGLAKTYLLQREYATRPDSEAYQKAEQAAEQALRLDPHQAEAHAILGFIKFFWAWDAPEAEREFRVAIEADERSILAHHWFGSMLMHQGRYPEALAQLALAQQLDPRSTAILATKALTLGFSGQKATGVRLLESMEHDGKEISIVHRDLSYLSLVAPRDPARFLEEARRFAEMRQDPVKVPLLRDARKALDRAGEPAMWAAILQGERLTHPDNERPSYMMAEAEAALGQDGAALAHLAKLAEARDSRVQGMMLEPSFLSLHNNAEFSRIAAQVGLLSPVVPRGKSKQVG